MAETLSVYRIVRFAALRSHITRQKWPKSSLALYRRSAPASCQNYRIEYGILNCLYLRKIAGCDYEYSNHSGKCLIRAEKNVWKAPSAPVDSRFAILKRAPNHINYRVECSERERIVNRLLRFIAKDPSVFGKVSRNLTPLIPGITRSLTLQNRLILGRMPRIAYSYCAVRAAQIAVRLGYKEVSMLEFGVAGGNGLIALEEIKDIIERYLPIKIRVFGFDLGSGLPMPIDYRDLPYHWQGGFYEMDVERLRGRLKNAELVLGPVAETVPAFLSRPPVNAPVGMISFDLDYYSSTVDAFQIFRLDRAAILPRVMCYMDDVVGTTECYSDFTGERLAIAEFNQKNTSQKLSPCYDFEDFMIERWQQKIMIYHDFTHPLYNAYVGNRENEAQIPLNTAS